MFDGHRLTELHEWWLWADAQAATAERNGVNAWQYEVRRDAYDAEIRARVSAQEIEQVGNRHGIYQLLFDVPDDRREYRTLYERTERALNYDQPHHWTRHADHWPPVEGCHLCREEQARRRIKP